MAYNKAHQSKDREEADLLLEVVLAHMAFQSARDDTTRVMARRRFVERVQTLCRAVTDPSEKEQQPTPALS
jgi:hypothetical protein